MATNAEIKRFIKEVRQEQDRRNSAKFATKAEIASALILRGSVSTFSDLPANAVAGDVYNIRTAGGTDMHGNSINAGDNVAYTADGGWDVLAGTFDTTSLVSNFETQIAGVSSDVAGLSSDVATISSALANKVDKVTGKQLSTNDFTNAYVTTIGALSTAVNATFSSADLTYIFADE